jgi:Tfp pilus assembly protein PilO
MEFNKLMLLDKYLSRKRQIIALIVICLFLLFLFINGSQSRQLKNLRVEAKEMNTELENLKAIIGKDTGVAAGMKKLQEEYNILSARFPAAEHEVIKELTNYAEKYDLAIESINPGEEKELIDSTGKPFALGAGVFKQADVNVKIKGSYGDIGRYIDSLCDKFPRVLTIRSMKISRQSERSQKGLTGDISMIAYFLIPKAE